VEIEVRGHRCVYETSGEGPWLTLLHSVGLSTRQGWRDQTEFFSRYFRVLSFDFRGLGESGRGAVPLGVDTFAADLAALLDQFGITRTMLMGVSLGGFVAQALTLLRPDLVSRLVLVSTAAKIFAGHAERREARNNEIRRHGMASAADHQLESHFPSDFAADHPAVIAWYRNHYLANDPESYIAIMDDLGRFDSSTHLHAINCPTLIVAGDHDTSSVAGRRPLDSAERLRALIPGAQLAVIEGGHHYPQIDHAAVFNQRVLEFLTAHTEQAVGPHGARLG
jgi:3-oxoadipate enol-lactonase